LLSFQGLIFQRIDWALKAKAVLARPLRTALSNQCHRGAAVPVAAAMRLSLGSAAAKKGCHRGCRGKMEAARIGGRESTRRRVDAAPASVAPWQIPARARRRCRRHVVDPRGAPGLAAQQASQRHPPAAPQSETFNRFVAIERTGRQVPAVVTDQRRQRVPVNPDQGAPGIARQAGGCAGAVHTML